MEDAYGKLWSLLSEEVKTTCDDATVKRYLKATAGDVKKAAQRIEDSAKWRKEMKPEAITCEACAKNPGHHYMNIIGHCKEKRPVFYSCMKLSRSKDVEHGKRHLINRFEQAIRMMPEGVEQWVWVSDFFGFSTGDMNPAMAKQFVDLSAVHYPERLGAYLVIDAPFIFEGLWKLVKPWLDPVTVQKIIFVPYDVTRTESKLKSIVHQMFPEDVAQWLLHEMDENRKRTTFEVKTSFAYADTYALATKGNLKYEGHDRHGCEGIIKLYNADPDLLLPQALA